MKVDMIAGMARMYSGEAAFSVHNITIAVLELNSVQDKQSHAGPVSW